MQARSYLDELDKVRKELDEAKQWKNQFESSSARLVELELVVQELRGELDREIKENKDLRAVHKEEKDEKEEVGIVPCSSFTFSALPFPPW